MSFLVYSQIFLFEPHIRHVLIFLNNVGPLKGNKQAATVTCPTIPRGERATMLFRPSKKVPLLQVSPLNDERQTEAAFEKNRESRSS